jgi:putative DNA methylase
MAKSARETTTRSVLRHLDVGALRSATRQESRSRQRHLPPISVYRWWARRTETVTGAILDAISADLPGRLLLADPFAGGGVIALASLLRGHQIYAQDVNPWAARSLATMLSLPAADDLATAGQRLRDSVADLLHSAYDTTFGDGTPATISHTLRVATGRCPGCGRTIKLFPAATVSLRRRVDCGGTTGYLACPAGHLILASATKRTSCSACHRYVKPRACYTTGRTARCADCRWTGKLSDLVGADGFEWEVVLVERTAPGRRDIGPPTVVELVAADATRWAPSRELPPIDLGIETGVLLRHGMHNWHDLYPARQRVVLEALLDGCVIAARNDERVARALEAAVIGSTEMAGFTSRWDARYLKAYEAVANHRFNFTTLTAEPNVWGAPESGRGTVDRRLEHLAKASLWLEERVGRPLNVDGPRATTGRRRPIRDEIDARVVSGGSQRLTIPAATLDAVITDPPYHDDVHYGELSDLFRAWAGEVTGALDGDAIVRRLHGESGTDAYQRLLTDIFAEIRRALRPDGHVVLSYANRHPGAWVALFSALEAAGFRAAGYTVVHSENETDHAKVGRRACMLDVLIDVVPATAQRVRQHQPKGQPDSDEETFCRLVGVQALRIGNLGADWIPRFTDNLQASAFLRH